MNHKVDMVVQDAASNVACEESGSKKSVFLSKDDLKKIKGHLMGLSEQSDDSFIYGLVKTLKEKDDKCKNERGTK